MDFDFKVKMENMQDLTEEDGYVVRIRGLPWSASQEEVSKFLEGCNVIGGKEGIHFTYVRDGRPSGEAYIELGNEEDLEKALSKNKQHMGRRYIEVFRSKRSEMEWVVKRSGPEQIKDSTDAVVRLRGLPFGCSKEEIAHFFTGLEIVPNGITLIHDAQGRTTGDAYCQFASMDIAEQAMSKHKERIGHRYIEIFKSSMMEARNAINAANRQMGGGGGGGMGMGPRQGMGMNRPGPYDRSDRFGGGGGMGMGGGFRGRGRANIKGYYDDGYYDDEYEFGGGYGGGRGGMGRRGGMGWGRGGSRGGGFGGGMGGRSGGGGMGGGGGRGGGDSDYDSQTGHCVHMRGLPFAATEQDILDFFKPMNPVNVVIHYNSDGRASGEADVDFATHEESKEAMHKDRATMQHRYIELFLKSTPAGRQGGSGFGGGYDSSAMGGGGFGNGVGANNPNYTAF